MKKLDHKVVSEDGQILLQVSNRTFTSNVFLQSSLYTIIILTKGTGSCKVDFGTYEFTAPAIVFATPFQKIELDGQGIEELKIMQFHGDFYCIEYHKKEVACNGLLFNNAYISPVLTLSDSEIEDFNSLYEQIVKEVEQNEELNEIVLTSYLQLFLAKSSKIKRAVLTEDLAPSVMVDEVMERFKILLEQHFLALHKPSDYANLLHITPNVLSKRCKLYFRKTPTQLIQERIIIEAKKKIHLTRLSIKEIAFELQFQDEHYFSRFFKKITGISPQKFRNSTGISIVADLSMQ